MRIKRKNSFILILFPVLLACVMEVSTQGQEVNTGKEEKLGNWERPTYVGTPKFPFISSFPDFLSPLVKRPVQSRNPFQHKSPLRARQEPRPSSSTLQQRIAQLDWDEFNQAVKADYTNLLETSPRALGTTAAMNSRENRFDPLILEYAMVRELSPYLIKAVMKAESNMDAKAVSPAKCLGLMQINPTGFRRLRKSGININRRTAFHPGTNIAAGTFILKEHLQKYDCVLSALIAYVAGSRKVVHIRSALMENKPVKQEVLVYLWNIVEAYQMYRHEQSSEEEDAL